MPTSKASKEPSLFMFHVSLHTVSKVDVFNGLVPQIMIKQSFYESFTPPPQKKKNNKKNKQKTTKKQKQKKTTSGVYMSSSSVAYTSFESVAGGLVGMASPWQTNILFCMPD